jgi:hypothetical protein
VPPPSFEGAHRRHLMDLAHNRPEINRNVALLHNPTEALALLQDYVPLESAATAPQRQITASARMFNFLATDNAPMRSQQNFAQEPPIAEVDDPARLLPERSNDPPIAAVPTPLAHGAQGDQLDTVPTPSPPAHGTTQAPATEAPQLQAAPPPSPPPRRSSRSPVKNPKYSET